MDADHALHHLTEVRDAVDDEMVEYVDTLARLVSLNQDITDPMLGAKVTVYQQAPTTPQREEKGLLGEGFVDEVEDRDDIRSANEYDDDDGTAMVAYYEWDYPDQPKVIPVEGIVFDANVAEQEETMYDPNREEYRTGDDYPLGTVNAVIPGQWENALDGYPEDALFSEGYCSETEDATSLIPRSETQKKYAFDPGWEAAQAFHLDGE